jgi:hypothetical protein
MYSMPVDVMLATDVTKSYVIPGFEISCGDTLWVGIRNTGTAPGTPWTVILDQSAGGSVYYTVLNQTVTLHWNGGSHIYVDIEAVLK